MHLWEIVIKMELHERRENDTYFECIIFIIAFQKKESELNKKENPFDCERGCREVAYLCRQMAAVIVIC